MLTSKNEFVLFILVTTAFALMLATFLISLLYAYQKRQLIYNTDIGNLQAKFASNLLQTQVEVQEQTFQHISKEIHDNINLSITLAKLNLNTLDWKNLENTKKSVNQSIELLSIAIRDLSNLSKSIDTDIIIELGLIDALENEIKRLSQITHLQIELNVHGEPIFLDSNRELIVFRIIQEAFNNIIKHSKASKVLLDINYQPDELSVCLSDNGIGFDKERYLEAKEKRQGVKNMESRTKMLGGCLQLESTIMGGTKINLKIPNKHETKHQNSIGG